MQVTDFVEREFPGRVEIEASVGTDNPLYKQGGGVLQGQNVGTLLIGTK